MPAIILGTRMDTGHVKWRSKFTSGQNDEGPEDKRLVIEFTGALSNLPWFVLSSAGGYAVNLDELSAVKGSLFDKAWLRDKGVKEARVAEVGTKFIIEVQV